MATLTAGTQHPRLQTGNSSSSCRQGVAQCCRRVSRAWHRAACGGSMHAGNNPCVGPRVGVPPRQLSIVRAREESGGADKGDHSGLDQYVEVKVDSVRVSQGNSIVYLRILTSENLVLQVHIGEHESSALLKEISKGRVLRPLTHDLTKNLLAAVGYRVTKIRITDIVSNTYYARVHVARVNAMGLIEGEEVDVDARPSDAINLAVRFGAPMYVNKRIAEIATALPAESTYGVPQGSETNQEIVRSVRETLASFEDPTVMYQLQKELAIKDQRYEDAHALQQYIYHEMTHNQLLRLVVAMEAALSDQRYEEAARLRDEYRRVVATQQVSSNTTMGDQRR